MCCPGSCTQSVLQIDPLTEHLFQHCSARYFAGPTDRPFHQFLGRWQVRQQSANHTCVRLLIMGVPLSYNSLNHR